MGKRDRNWKYPRTRLQWLWDNMEGHRFIYVCAILGTVVYNMLQLTVPFFSGKIVDEFLTGEGAKENMALHPDQFFKLLALMVGLTIFRCIIVYLDCMAYEKVSQDVLFKVRNFLYNKIQRQDMKFYSTYRTGDLMTRVTGDLDAVRHMVAWVVRMVVEAFSLVTATAIYFIIMDWKLAFSLLIVAPLIFFIIYVFKLLVAPMHALLREKLAYMNTVAQENIAGNRVVKAFAREEYEISKFDDCNQDYRDTNKKTAGIWLRFYPFVETLANLLAVILLLVGGMFLINGEMSMGQYVSFSGLIWAIANPMRQLGNVMNEFQRFSAASAKVMEIYYSEPEIVDAPDAVDVQGRFKGEVEFKNVSFQYADAKLPVLEHISFTAKPGQTIAIMGETGCGKTSLIHLIPRFYEPTEGEILIDGVNVNKLKLSQLRKNIGLATQDVLLYSDTIDGNIAYGDSNISKEEVVRFAKYSAASDFIAKMPEGYDTIVGERGVGLSGGQKQRISLARALAVKPSILILDDTTSAVDLETEKEIQDSLRHLDFPCTKIIIAQRISTTKDADQILIMQHGEIKERGTHEELIKLGGYYAELVKLQAGA
ncbi:ABC transporter ATP-binding protein [Butyrivibrio sp. VCB2006]|uniref:ABC transporter ATP-binding protein n=1 Tax=Butyrivibrio sp. VCB2006 TaxID=1280679 RepID=UPI0003F675C5|nr:ABC transporter ATP-binding protein [Butyrivibrio sp. VCB2006]